MDSLKFSSSFWSAGIPPGHTFTAAMFIVSLFLIFLRHIEKEVNSIWETFSKEHSFWWGSEMTQLKEILTNISLWKQQTFYLLNIPHLVPSCGQVISSYCFPTVPHLHEWLEVFSAETTFWIDHQLATKSSKRPILAARIKRKKRSWNL